MNTTMTLLFRILENRTLFLLLALTGYLVGCSYWGFLYILLETLHILDALKLAWKSTQYVVNYIDHGFLRRGFLGTILYPFYPFFAAQPLLLYAFIILLDVLVFFALCFLFHRHVCRCDNIAPNAKILLMCLFLFSPYGVMQFGHEIGRSDHLLYLLAIISAVLIFRKNYISAAIISAIACLIHEAFFIFGFPLLAGTVVFTGVSPMTREGALNVVKYSALPLMTILLLFFFGTPEAGKLDAIPDELAVGIEVYYRDTFDLGAEYKFALQKFVIIFYAVAPILLCTRIYLTQKWSFDFLYLACFAPIALFVFGVDYTRWCGILGMVCLMVVLIKSTRHAIKHQTLTIFDKALFAFLLLPLGSIGIIEPLPFIEGIYQTIISN